MYNADIAPQKESALFYFKQDFISSNNKNIGLCISEVSTNAYFVLRGDRSSAALEQALYKHLKLYLPQHPREMVKTTGTAIYYVSFDEWLIVVDQSESQRVNVDLRTDLSGHFQLVDITGGMTKLQLQGKAVHMFLQKLCEYDFHPSRFPIKACVQTKIAKSSGLVVREGENMFGLYIRRSFADYIAAWCLDAVN
ncbi:MAG: sarcosine oxidase subunit gamma family protein [Coxiellaceae bacterium]|nr:sarcosine oxidase subunit gamma family protein [Coxiellaceae bacterium]